MTKTESNGTGFILPRKDTRSLYMRHPHHILVESKKHLTGKWPKPPKHLLANLIINKTYGNSDPICPPSTLKRCFMVAAVIWCSITNIFQASFNIIKYNSPGALHYTRPPWPRTHFHTIRFRITLIKGYSFGNSRIFFHFKLTAVTSVNFKILYPLTRIQFSNT